MNRRWWRNMKSTATSSIHWVGWKCTKNRWVHHSYVAVASRRKSSKDASWVNMKAGCSAVKGMSVIRLKKNILKWAVTTNHTHKIVLSKEIITSRIVVFECVLAVIFTNERSKKGILQWSHKKFFYDYWWYFYCLESHPQSTKNVSAAARVRS